jgi:hypothetical protein
MSDLVCKLCGQPISSLRSAWRESAGWVSPHGAKAMTGAHQTGALAHAECVASIRAGVSVAQESLV